MANSGSGWLERITGPVIPGTPASTLHSIGRLALFGAVGGGVNAASCCVRVALHRGVSLDWVQPYFTWHMVPAGMLHGALLAAISLAFTALLMYARPLIRWIGFFTTGWLAGWISWIPIYLSLNASTMIMPDSLTNGVFTQAFVWPFTEADLRSLWLPYLNFGCVGLIAFALWNGCRQLYTTRLSTHLLIGMMSGILGSLWFWLTYQPGYMSVLHGAVWGLLIGFGVWRSRIASRAPR